MRKPNVNHSAYEGYHQFLGGIGSFEVFWNDGALESDVEGEPMPTGWYWWPCFPGCMPDSDPSGPFTSSHAAWRDARD